MTPEEVVSKVFGVDRRTISDATSNTTLAEWDSLAHMTLVVELESAYSLSLSAEDALQLTSVAEIKRVLQRHGARW